MTAPVMLAGRYELRGTLGRGGWAEVRDGWDTRLDRPVAVKLLYTGFSADPANRRRFEAEARAAAALNHPYIVAVHDYGEHDGMPFIVMERLPGNTLADVISRGPVPQQLVRGVLDDVLAALVAAHDVGILHRDIKPGNILFTPSGHVKVTDFGIAKTAGSEPTATGQIMGTMAYLSPDRVAGKPATVSDDLYAVGVVGYEALTGRRLFAHENMGALARAILDEQPPPIAAVRPDADPALAAVIDRAMARDPLQRFVSARQMRAALSGAIAGQVAAGPLAAPATRPPTRVLTAPPPLAATFAAPARTAWPRPSRTKTLIGLGAAFALAILAAVLILADSSMPSPEPVTTSTSVPTPTSAPPPPPPPSTPVMVEEEKPDDRKGEGHKKGAENKKGEEGRGQGRGD